MSPGTPSTVVAFPRSLVGAAFLVALVSAAPRTRAAPLSAYRSQHLTWFSQALGVPPSAISGLRALDVERVPTSAGLLVGFVEQQGRRTAAVLPIWPCAGGRLCWAPERLGPASAILVTDVVDLAAPKADLAPARPLVSRLVPARTPAWPAVIVQVENRDGRGSDTYLVVISLRAPARRLLRHHAGSGGDGGFSTRGMRVERGGSGQPELVLIEQHELPASRARCLRPRPVERRFHLVGDQFRELPRPGGRAAPGCH